MTSERDKPAAELIRLISELIDGQLPVEDERRLCELLRDNPPAQEVYRELMSVHALLHLDFGLGHSHLLPPVAAASSLFPPPPDRWWVETNSIAVWARNCTKLRRAAIATAALAAGLALFFARPQSSIHHHPVAVGQLNVHNRQLTRLSPLTEEAFLKSDVRVVAILSQATGVNWSDRNLPTDVGAPLPVGHFNLRKGLIQIEFFSGASVVIEAPARFEIVSPEKIVCDLGKVRAHVPRQAQGFIIETPTHRAVDLGTEFTVRVDPAGQSEFHVLDGEVELWNRRDVAVLAEKLTAGYGARSTPDGNLAAMAFTKSTFVGRQQLLEITKAADQERFQHWQQASRNLREAENTILYYGFDGHDPWERVLRNDGRQGNPLLNGAIVGCQWTTGRWKNKQALEFKRTGDRVRLNVPGEFESLTLAAWVRIEGFERWLSSLMLTDGHELGAIHWQMTDMGQIMIGVKALPDQSHDYYSPSVLKPADLGRWVHLACVINGDANYVAHYLDGIEVSREAVRKPTLLRIGPAEIGNWVPQDLIDNRIRSLNGRLDEFILFNKPLLEVEIFDIYNAGKPQS